MTRAPLWLPLVILFGLLLLAYLGMWRGWRRRARKHRLPPLVDVADPLQRPAPELEAMARYFGTTTSGDWLDRVVAHGLGPRSSCRLSLSEAGLDVIRISGPFRIPADALRGARHDLGIAGKVVPPHGVLVVTWQHGDYLLDTGFRLAPDTSTTEAHNQWVRMITQMADSRPEPAEGESA